MDNGDGTVTDNLTGLMWPKNANLPGTFKTWQQAVDFANGLSLCDYRNWRLPTRKELYSLSKFLRYDLTLLSRNTFLNMQSPYYWSSTHNANNPGYAWIVPMRDGYVGYYSKSYNFNYVWPVRSTCKL